MKTNFLRIIIFVILVSTVPLNVFSQYKKYDLTDKAAIERLTCDLTILASDSLLGREAGSYAEELSRSYIIKKFEEIGLRPFFGDTSFLQSFIYSDTPSLGKENKMKVNSKELKLYKEFYPLSYSGSTTVKANVLYVGYGITALEFGYDDYKNISNSEGSIFLIDLNIPKKFKSKNDFLKYGKKIYKIENAVQKGAKAIVFVTNGPDVNIPSSELSNSVKEFALPVVFVKDRSVFKGNDDVEISVDIKKGTKRTSCNIAGYIDNKAKLTIVFGAHYDHLGSGWFGSRKSGEYDVYNGADDNASGTVGVIELARQISNSGLKDFNFLFIAFSGEEKGLYGSQYFVNSKDAKIGSINCMIDLDMIGRMGDNKTVKVFGTGTSSKWKKILKTSMDGKHKIVFVKSQADGSDHIPFYNKGIPVLFFTTGLHADYHTPGDIISKVNIAGELEILKYVMKLLGNINNQEKLDFTETTRWQMVSGLRHFIL
jgi:hypothetical protein